VSDNPQLLLALRRLRPLLRRIQDEWDDRPHTRVRLRAGDSLPVRSSRVQIRCVAPDGAGAARFFADPDLGEAVRKRANELSAVLEVHFGSCRILLCADLPEHDHGAGDRTGWSKVLSDFPDLPGSLGLKVPHHGSDGAMHPGLLGPGVAPEGAVWAVTPFKGGDSPVPALRDGRGAAALLRCVPILYLTALPGGWGAPAHADGDAVAIEDLYELPVDAAPRADSVDRSLAFVPPTVIDGTGVALRVYARGTGQDARRCARAQGLSSKLDPSGLSSTTLA
jgi:hypothetical protein